ncbi:MAG: YajD family HNH nuclease [Candidatus Competibacteraceae bacterium]|nr:YajD family HNH nuclease [Candidatus Competibacteraceae bacterium]MCB1812182.1 YajD family HNH nuclease [Candidatus Competibacteraceae bacterium]
MNRYKPANPANKVDQLIEQTHRNRAERERGYRAQALKMYPWICGRCEREFTHSNLRELTVHHRDHNHDNNPPDGSNWELLCLYCHDNEHARFIDAQWGGNSTPASPDQETVTHKPFEALADLLKRKE